MADCSRAQITIGGRISTRLILPLCEAITRQRLFVPSENGPFAPTWESDLIAARQLVAGAYVLRMEDNEAHNGEFAALESFLIENGIAFDRRTWGHYEFGAGIVFYRPKTGREVWPIDHEGTLLVAAAPLLDGLRELHRVCDEAASMQQFLELCDYFKLMIPAVPPKLTQLNFVSPADLTPLFLAPNWPSPSCN